MFTIKRLAACIIVILLVTKLPAQVNLQTGSATFSLPMFNWQDDKSRLNSVVALSYNSGNGLKVNDIASNVGQGWNLVAGGVISRMQVGEPDDQYPYGTPDNIKKYPAGKLFATVPATNGCPIALTKYPIYGVTNQFYAQHNIIAEDKQLDYFSFQFNGKAGMFVLDPANIGAARSLGDTKMIISFEMADMTSAGIRTRISSFTIKDVDGLIYKFAQKGLTKILESNYCDRDLNYLQKQPKLKSDHVYHQASFDNNQFVNPFVVGSWYLSEIDDPLVTNRKVIFNYTTKNINARAGEDISYNANKDYCIINHKTSITQNPEISSINYPDQHIVTFNYGADRIDFAGEKVLSTIDIQYQGRFLSEYQLNTSYFILSRYGTPVTAYQKRVARLCLRSVTKIGVDLLENTPPYIFDYYMGSADASHPDDFVPPPYFYAKDVWGFYNGNNNVDFWNDPALRIPLDASISDLNNNQLKGLCFLQNGIQDIILNPKPGFARNGLLKQIVYPTGGTLTYEYDQNSGQLNGIARYVGGVHVSKTSSTDGGYSNGCANPIVTNYNYVMNGQNSASSLWGLEMPVNVMVNNNHYQPEYRSYHWTWRCAPFGCCYWHFQYPGIIVQQSAISLTTGQNIMNAISPVLGIISIITTITDIANLIGATNPGFGTIAAVVIDIISGILTIVFTCFGDNAKDSQAIVFYNSDLNGIAPLPAQFKRVEVTESPGTIGKTVQEFTSDDDYPIWVNSNPVFAAKQRFAPWAYGLPKYTTVYDVSGNKVKETQNNYGFNEIETSCISLCPDKVKKPLNIKSAKCLVTKNTSQRNTDWSDINQYNDPLSYKTSSIDDMGVDIYDLYTGRVELDSTMERVYKSGDPSQFLQTVTHYYYNSYKNYDIRETITAQSNGDVNYKFINYNSDYTGGALTVLQQNNINSIPVSTSVGIAKNANLPLQYINETVTEFTQLANGDIKPLRSLEQRFAQPKTSTAMTFYQGPGSNTTNYKVPQTFSYDTYGNMVGLKDEGNRTITNIYDYDDKYVIASVINADPVQDKSLYSSFETTESHWNLNGTAAYDNTKAVTGSRSFILSPNNSLFSSILNPAKGYTVSFWATNSNVTVTGGTLTKSAPTINGFTYYEFDILQNPNISNVTVSNSSGTSIIDELRLYPKTARMRTTTYDPIIGKTSECDVNNRITYYEYDNLGRLRFIKDEYKNVVKMYEYNNVSAAKQNGCPGTYSNHFISEVFTKSDCPGGYLAGTVTYSVNAGTYTSSYSQADADAQAEQDILTHGQDYADQHATCSVLYYNTQQSGVFITQTCDEGHLPGEVTYTVPAGRYSSTISQADANELAQDEIYANGQVYANDPAHANCTYDTNPHWEWYEGGETQCVKMPNGENHLWRLALDINPNSQTYGSTSWQDSGLSDICSSAEIVTLVYENGTSYDEYVVVTNTVTGQQNIGTAMHGQAAILFAVEAGVYNIEIFQSLDLHSGMFTAGCNYSASGISGIFLNIPLNSSCNTISIIQ